MDVCSSVCVAQWFTGFKQATSTTQEEYDKIVLHNSRYHGKKLVCKTCRQEDGRVNRNFYFCGRCNTMKDRKHFTDMAMKNWRRRGETEGALKCKQESKQSKVRDTSTQS